MEITGNDAKKAINNKEKTWLTCREAASLLNYSQRHIVNLINKGKLSADKDDDGRYYIQKSEFFRVYPNAIRSELPRTEEKSSGNNSAKMLEEKVRHLQEMIEEKKKQNDFLLDQLSINTEEKSKMLDAINNHSRLLEFKETRGNTPSSAQEKKLFSWWPFRKR